MELQAYNQRVVKCANERCPHYNIERPVSLPIVGNGLFLTGGVMCECGYGGETIRVQE